MADELEKTCENCKYEYEDIEDTHCRHCIHNAEEHFEPKEVELSEQEIRAKAIDEFASALANKDNIVKHDIDELMESSGNFDLACNYLRAYIDEIAGQMKGGAV